MPVCFAGSDTVCELTATAGVQAVNQATQAMGKILPYLIGVVLVISLFGALFYSRYITGPLFGSAASPADVRAGFSGHVLKPEKMRLACWVKT